MAHGLNPAQHAAVETLSGPLLVLAGAGTGKTRVVTTRIANLIKHRIKPDRILAVTFTRKAAGEMQERALALLGGPEKPGKTHRKAKPKGPKIRPQISTFHALCVQVLRRHITHLGYPPQFAICDRGDQESLARTSLRDIRCPEDSLRPGDLLAIISNWKNKSLRPMQAASEATSDKEHLAAAAYRRYQSSLKARGMVDFDDLLLCTEELFTKHPAIRREESGRFDHVLVDEYQDTNGSQYRIVKALAMGHRNLCVVGDDDQSIYGWRGAEVEHILRFKEDWPDAKVVRLEENYRSAGAILEYANTLIAFNKKRHDKILRPARGAGQRPIIMQLPDETQEAERVVGDIHMQLTQPGMQAKDFAILCRTNEQPRAFETELRRLKLPYILVGGQSFFDRKEVRDLLAYLKTVENPTDETSLLRIINTPPRGIGNATVKQLLAEAVNRGEPIWTVLREAAGGGGATGNAIGKFVKLIGELKEIADRGAPVDKLVDAVVDRTQYRRELDRLYPDPMEREARTASIEELINAGAAYNKGKKTKKDEEELPLLRGFLDDVALGGSDNRDEKEDQLQRNAIALMTLHSAKGLEFPYVYMVGMEEGILPHKRTLEMPDESQIDEERRLCYVGVTRAQEKLTMSFALTRRKWGKPKDTVPSRFLYEMTGQAENAAKARAAAAATLGPHKKHPAAKGAGGPKGGKGAKGAKGSQSRSPRR